ncbi:MULTISPECIES: MarR family winged helix-turn-helix transcriptional regulator [Cryobacterium]|uniref:MarR family transcriptional regulator n=1 Tax=Cryobacterium breve TaxID=1259258 RepID=A0ABY2J669_9MICO|nr:MULTISPECIES: MarR family winged helix-turn-helix transcriptional regulator [Cryobacterium]TFC95209.1 MarR family transcriptional regulator [Cryobacterium sp. TmT3-12]TFD00335.1 MarR family transcriptional regulator [Cryobacterium breve]
MYIELLKRGSIRQWSVVAVGCDDGSAANPAGYLTLMSGEIMAKGSGSVHVLEGVAAAVVVFLRAMDEARAGMAARSSFTGSEIRIGFRISGAGRVKPKMLAGSMDLTTGAVTAISDRLVARVIARRAANPEDRRSLFLEPTGTGETLMESLHGDFRARIGEAQRKMSRADQELPEVRLLRIASALGHDLEDGLAGTHISAVKRG